jgi:inner membrane transporter RhtA
MKTAVLLLFIAMISIQLGAGFAKSLFPIVGSAGTSTLRLFFATMILWIIWRPWTFRFEKSSIKNLALYGTSLGLMNLTFYFALQRIPLGLAVTLEFVGPLTLSVLSSRKKTDFIWVLLAAVGIYLVMPESASGNSTDILGIIYALIAGAFWAFYIYFGQRAGNNVHGGMVATAGMTVAALVVTPFGLLIDGSRLFNVSILPLALLVAALSSALPYSLEMISLKRMPAKTFSILMSLEPAVASLVGIILLKEQLQLIQWLAIALIITASIGSVVSASREKGALQQ